MWRGHRGPVAYLTAAVLVGLIFGVYAGCDWTETGRYFAPYVPAAVILFFIAVLFIAIQALSYFEIATIDWTRAVELMNDLVMSAKENQTWWEVIKNRLPAGAGIVGGWVLGFRKG